MHMKKRFSYSVVLFGLLAIFSCQNNKEDVNPIPDARFLVKNIDVHDVEADKNFATELSYDSRNRLRRMYDNRLNELQIFDYVNDNEIILTDSIGDELIEEVAITLENGQVVASQIKNGNGFKHIYNADNQLISTSLDEDNYSRYEWSDGNVIKTSYSFKPDITELEYTTYPHTINVDARHNANYGFFGAKLKNFISKINYGSTGVVVTFSYDLDQLGRPTTVKEYKDGTLVAEYTYSYLQD